MSLFGSVATSFNFCVLGWLSDWYQQFINQEIPAGETEGVGPKSGPGKSGHGMLKLACWECQRLSCGTT